MRILISTLWLGGAGGSERAVHSAIGALAGEQVDVVTGSLLDGPWSDVGDHARVFAHTHWRWRGANAKGPLGRPLATLVNPMRRALFPTYDVHISFPHSHGISPAARARLRLVIPGGSEPAATAKDVIALEAPDNHRFVPPGCRSVLLPPPLGPLARDCELPGVDLPSQYLLTVFNPYDSIKGADDLVDAATDAPMPIVWCHSDRTLQFTLPHELVHHPNVVHVTDARPGQLRYLYENCVAYLAFSRSEGFGWAAADALQYSRTIVTRPVGVFSFVEAHQAGVHLVGPDWQFDWSKLESDTTPTRDLDWLSPAAYARRLTTLTQNAQLAGPSLSTVSGDGSSGSETHR